MSTEHRPPFAPTDIPFSFHGSWLNLSPVTAEGRIESDIHLITHQTGFHPILRLVPVLDGRRVDTTWSADPASLRWTHERGTIEAAFESADTVRIPGRGLALRLPAHRSTLAAHSGTYCFTDPMDGSWVLTVYESGRRYRITTLRGVVRPGDGPDGLSGPGDRGLLVGPGPDGDGWELAIEEFTTARRPYHRSIPFERVRANAAAEFGSFLQDVAPWRSPEYPATALAGYVLWSATVRPGGFLGRPAVLMSKHWMDKVWSWDHCFNAIALAAGRPALALDQFLLPFDHQLAHGALPDSVSHSGVLANFVKPPVHGWALRQLRARLPADLKPDVLAEIYAKLAAWSQFWLDFRRAPGQRLPHYQHGNDSGWDNSTVFDAGPVTRSADLAALLAGQLHELAGLAGDLGRPVEQHRWRRLAAELREAMVDELWTGRQFVARHAITGAAAPSASLLTLLPLTLGSQLPPPVRQQLIAALPAHLTEWGLATEPITSPHYRSDGYWRGPIWAPPTVLLVEALQRLGRPELAGDLSARFRRLCEKSGFAENFDALTGAGLRDRAYSWTASSYLILAAADAGHPAVDAGRAGQLVSG